MVYYDGLPHSLRIRLQESPYNICAACIMTELRVRKDVKDVVDYFEAMIRKRERIYDQNGQLLNLVGAKPFYGDNSSNETE